jgi:hypothetical protein
MNIFTLLPTAILSVIFSSWTVGDCALLSIVDKFFHSLNMQHVSPFKLKKYNFQEFLYKDDIGSLVWLSRGNKVLSWKLGSYIISYRNKRILCDMVERGNSKVVWFILKESENSYEITWEAKVRACVKSRDYAVLDLFLGFACDLYYKKELLPMLAKYWTDGLYYLFLNNHFKAYKDISLFVGDVIRDNNIPFLKAILDRYTLKRRNISTLLRYAKDNDEMTSTIKRTTNRV